MMSTYLGRDIGAIFFGVCFAFTLVGISWWPTHPLQRRSNASSPFTASLSPLDTPLAIARLFTFFSSPVFYLDNELTSHAGLGGPRRAASIMIP
jgi:hypothetical protein